MAAFQFDTMEFVVKCLDSMEQWNEKNKSILIWNAEFVHFVPFGVDLQIVMVHFDSDFKLEQNELKPNDIWKSYKTR